MQLNPIELIPILSKDIEITNLSKADFVLSNEKHKHYIKISKEVKDLISIIDNKKNIIEITDFYNINFNSSISSDFVFNLIYKKLSKYGLLENYGEIKKTNKPNYLKLSIIIINERTVEKIVKCFYFLFKPRIALCFLIFSFIFFAYTINTFLDQYHEFNIQKSIISLFIITLFSGILHEIGHATSTSLFGSKHGGIGIGFYLFSPVLFADVTDIWRLSKTKRIIVNLSGIYFEILFCTTILLLNILLKNNLLGILTTFVFIKTFTNLNPLIRSDGYWVLTDLTNQPNLFKNAYSKIKDLFFFIIKSKKIKWDYIDVIVFLYGVLSFIFIGYFLFYILIVNPNSIIYFPNNLLILVKSIFTLDSKVSIKQFSQLLIPIIFFYFVFNLLKNSYLGILRKHKEKSN